MSSQKNQVSDIHGEQILVDGQWFHAERIFGKVASEYIVGQLVEDLVQTSVRALDEKPDELVSCALYRGCSSNEMIKHKISAFVDVMLSAGGWGDFPMISGYVETLDANNVAQCERLVADGHSSTWFSEFGWSRMVTSADIGARYIHIDNGHHRMAAAAIASEQIGTILVPVFDRKREEEQPQFLRLRP